MRLLIHSQDWGEESSSGFQKSKLSSQCNHRSVLATSKWKYSTSFRLRSPSYFSWSFRSYKIYAEGYAWSVSLKYILSCGSLAFVIDPQYEDFFSRGLVPKENYWPVSSANLCRSIKSAVDWGNAHPSQVITIFGQFHLFSKSRAVCLLYVSAQLDNLAKQLLQQTAISDACVSG